MKTKRTTLLAIAALASVSQAAVYINFDGSQAGGGPATGAPFGIDSSLWTNTGDVSENLTGISVGSTTVTWTSNNTWGGGAAPTIGDETVYGGYLDDGGQGTNDATVTITGLDAEFAGGAYNVTVYGFSDNSANIIGEYDIGGTTVLGSTVASTGTLPGNYGIASRNNISGDSLVISGVSDSTRDRRETISGITITPVPEPSGAALLGLGGLALILRRRK